MPEVGDSRKAYYDQQYQGDQYAVYESSDKHPFFSELQTLLTRFGNKSGCWLEAGCGRGLLQDVVENYTGIDVAETVAEFLHKPFVCGSVENLPFENDHFDGCWSYAVLEHVENPEQVLEEIRRTVKPGGMLFLAPAWQCRSWAGKDYAWKPYRDLSVGGRFRKLCIPIRDSVMFRSCRIFPLRAIRLLAFLIRRKPTPWRSRLLQPNYSEYQVIDADARHSIDPFDVILWFRSRGDEVLSHADWGRMFFVRTGTLVVRVNKK